VLHPKSLCDNLESRCWLPAKQVLDNSSIRSLIDIKTLESLTKNLNRFFAL